MPVSRAKAWKNQAIKKLAWFHRWLGVATCLVFALWFASGAVLLFKPFPSLSHADQLRLGAPIDLAAVAISPRAAAVAVGQPVSALRLVQRGGSPAYVATTSAGTIAIDARSGRRLGDLTPAALANDRVVPPGAAVSAPFDYDQWVVHNRFDPLRPLYRIDVADGRGTSLYLSARTGEPVQRTDAADRGWNWVGAVLHWAYFTLCLSTRTRVWII